MTELFERLNTPPAEVDQGLFDAINGMFGPLTVDLAATADDTKCPRWIGPDRDSLKQDWVAELDGGAGWLNAPFGDIQLWAEKMAAEAKRGAQFIAIVPAAVDASWWWDYVEPNAVCLAISPRMLYEGLPIPITIALFCGNKYTGIVGRFKWEEPAFDIPRDILIRF